MKVSLIVNFEKAQAKETALAVIETLNGFNAEVLCNSEAASKLAVSNITVAENGVENADICVALGGDGTIIHTAKSAAKFAKPILGINTGRIGYLAAIKANELDLLQGILRGEYDIEERMMLDVNMYSGNNATTYTAFNDAVITKGSLSRMIDIELSVDGHKVNYRSDGLIISTPTGSTAYSLSAGGPVIDPRVSDILITPICPYSCFTRPMIVPYGAKLTVTADTNGNKEAYLTVDGEVAVKINSGDAITVTRSDTTVKLISLKTRPGYYNLGEIIK